MFSYVLKVKVEEAFSYVTLQMKLNHLEIYPRKNPPPPPLMNEIMTNKFLDSDGQ
jgi:hypothetical protein